jgi:hypothetical protein
VKTHKDLDTLEEVDRFGFNNFEIVEGVVRTLKKEYRDLFGK